MPSSARSGAPLPANIRTNSSTSIHVDREVTVMTSAADGSKKRAIYSTLTPVVNGHGRAQSSQSANAATASAPALNRWDSTPKIFDTSSSNHPCGRSQSMREAAPESNRDTLRALSDFLMCSEPPVSNFMSRPESDAESLHPTKRPAFKIFGRQKNKKAKKGPKLLRLPDSAVAAKTIGGARHIAISIPIEYDHLDYHTPAKSLPPSWLLSQHSQPKIPIDRGAVTVLKPVVEVRESGSSFLTKTRSDEELQDEKRNPHAESVVTPAAEVLDLETTRTLEIYYTQLNRQQRSRPKSSNTDGKLAVRSDSTRTQKSYVTVSPVDITRQDSTRSGPRYSSGTVYSTSSHGTYPAHSRGQSCASSAPSATLIAGLKLDLPPRSSSITKVSPAVQTELAKSYAANKGPVVEDPINASYMSDKSALSANESTTSSTSQSPQAVFGTAETAKIHNAAAGLQTISRSSTPKSLLLAGPAPTRQLPDVPESPCIPSFLPSPSPPVSQKNSPNIEVNDDSIKPKSSTSVKSSDSRQSRQYRVKARKQRDMAMHRDKSTPREKDSTRAPLAEAASSTHPQIFVTAPAKSSKRRTISQEKICKRAQNSVTDIMLVADLAPYTGLVRMKDLPFLPSTDRALKRKVRDSDSNCNVSPRGTHTPPSSIMESESDTVTRDRSIVRSREGKSSVLDARRQERRVKRNRSLREKEIDARLGKIERDNAMLLSTLSGIANSFGELSRALPGTRSASRGQGRMSTDVESEMRESGDEDMVKGELTRLDSVMADLDLRAGKISQESLKGSQSSAEDYDGA